MSQLDPKIDQKDVIFHCVSVCRSFTLEGLLEINKTLPSPIAPVDLIWKIGELSARGDIMGGQYIVNHEKAKEFIENTKDTSGKPSISDLHEAWRDWYQSKFEQNYKAEDLAELLYHEAAYFKYSEPQGDVIHHLQAKTRHYLRTYSQSDHFRQEEFAEYKKHLITQLECEELDRIDWIMSSNEDLTAFIKFIDSVDPLIEEV